MSTHIATTDFAKVIESMPLKDLRSILMDISGLFGKGHITETDYDHLYGLAHSRMSPSRDRLLVAPGCLVVSLGDGVVHSTSPAEKRSQRSPDRQKSIDRRKRYAASNPLPSTLEWRFTIAEQSVLAIVRIEAGNGKPCTRSIPELAARAGVSETTVRTTLKEAVRLGLITREERRRRGRLNLTNVLRIVSAEWLAWINRGPARKASPRPSREPAPLSTGGVVQFSEPHVRTDTYRTPSKAGGYAIG